MKANEIKNAAIELVKVSTSCKQVSAHYSELVEKYGKKDAVKIRDKAKEMIKAYNETTKENANNVIKALSDGERVAKSIWDVILKDKTINKFAVKVWEYCDKDIVKIINTFARYKDENGNACKRHNSKITGVYYSVFSLENSSVPSALAMLKQAIRNAKTGCISEKRTYKYIQVVPIKEEK